MDSIEIVSLVHRFMDEVWNQGDFSRLDILVAETYTVYSDPGDPWNGKSIDHKTFVTRVDYTRRAFPDVRFNIQEAISNDDRVAIRWTMTGTHTGDLPSLPATNEPFVIEGMTFYYTDAGKISGHRQAFDQLGFLAQIGMLRLGGNES